MVLSLPTVLSLPHHSRVVLVPGMAARTLLVTAAAWLLPWDRWNRRWLLAWPLLMLSGLIVAAAVSPKGSIASLTGLIAVAFLYIGLTQPPWTGVAFLPAAFAVWAACYGGWSHQLEVKAPIAIGIWIIISETISRLRGQVLQLTSSLEALSLLDPLTGLASRRALDAGLATAGEGDVIVFLDIDHFKAINDRHGHAVGDEVLSDLGDALRHVMKRPDLAARFGGEEFMLILHNAGIDGTIATLERLKVRLAQASPGFTFSAGVALIGSGVDSTRAIAAADAALYLAKQTGRDRWEVAAPDLGQPREPGLLRLTAGANQLPGHD
jgi:diguanylate cyclase (GGDEF)-like protein